MDVVFALPITFKAELRGGRRYDNPRRSRIGQLNDSVFLDATDLLSFLIKAASASDGQPVAPSALASVVLSGLQASNIRFEDVSGDDVLTLTLARPKFRSKPTPGDIVAIPAKGGGYHMALIVARNRFGTCLGFLRGIFPLPVIDPGRPHAVRRHPMHTDDQLIAKGVWNIVGHDETLLTLFPTEPEIYHAPDLFFPDVDLGEFGAAETADGTIRLIGLDEAVEVGLRDGTYRQGYVSEFLQRLLDDEVASRQFR